MTAGNVYDFTLRTLDGESLALSRYAGRPLVIVNTASKCGFTPQYEALQALWQEFRDAGLVMIGVPSNDFGNQEPGTSATIAAFCRDQFGVDFPMAARVHVRGPEADPLFKWLAAEGGFFARPRWNFYKYLIGSGGGLADWFASGTKPDSKKFRRAVARLLEG